MAGTVIISGISASGKTTLIGMAKPSCEIVTLGSVMEKIGIEMGLVRNRDELKSLSHTQDNKLRSRAWDQISKGESGIGKILVLDTHTTIETGARLEPALPSEFVSSISGLRSLVYVSAPSSVIIERRQKDASIRPRGPDTERMLDMQRSVDLSVMGYLSASRNLPLYIIENDGSNTESAVSELKRAIEESMAD